MNHELKQVDVRLKLVDKEGVFSMESIDTPAKAVSIMAPILAELDREEVCVVNLDGKNHPINFNIVSIGSLNASLVTGREVYKSAVLSNAARVIMLHNHPSSSLAPSREDREVTGKMMYAGSFLDIELQDHIIVAGRTGETFSMREHLPELFDRKNYMEPMAHVADLVREMGDRQRRLKTMSESTFIKKCESRVCRYKSVKCCCMEAEAGGQKSRLLIWMF